MAAVFKASIVYPIHLLFAQSVCVRVISRPRTTLFEGTGRTLFKNKLLCKHSHYIFSLLSRSQKYNLYYRLPTSLQRGGTKHDY